MVKQFEQGGRTYEVRLETEGMVTRAIACMDGKAVGVECYAAEDDLNDLSVNNREYLMWLTQYIAKANT